MLQISTVANLQASGLLLARRAVLRVFCAAKKVSSQASAAMHAFGNLMSGFTPDA